MEVGKDDPERSYKFPGGFCHGQPDGINKTNAQVHFFCGSFSVYKQGIGNQCATGKNAPAIATVSEPEESTAPGPSGSPAHCSETPPLIIPLLPDIPLMGTSPGEHPLAEFLAISTKEKQNCSSYNSLNLHLSKRTCVDFSEVKAGSDHSSAQGNNTMPEPIPEAGPSSQQREQESNSTPCYPTGPSLTLMTKQPQKVHGALGTKHPQTLTWLRHGGSVHSNCPQEVLEEGTGFL